MYGLCLCITSDTLQSPNNLLIGTGDTLNYKLTLTMLRLLSSKAQERKDFKKSSNPVMLVFIE